MIGAKIEESVQIRRAKIGANNECYEQNNKNRIKYSPDVELNVGVFRNLYLHRRRQTRR